MNHLANQPKPSCPIRTNEHILTIAKILRWSSMGMQHGSSGEKVSKGGIFSYGISRGQLTLATNLSANVLVTLNAWRAGGVRTGTLPQGTLKFDAHKVSKWKKEFLARDVVVAKFRRWRQQLVIKTSMPRKNSMPKVFKVFPGTTQEKLMDLEMDLNVLRSIATYPIWKGVVLENFR